MLALRSSLALPPVPVATLDYDGDDGFGEEEQTPPSISTQSIMQGSRIII